MPSPPRLFHLVAADTWARFEASGTTTVWEPPGFAGDGFVHLSLAEQLQGTLARHFAGDDRVVLFEVDAAAVAADLRMEPAPRSGILFPHVYRGIAPRELLRRWTLERTDGHFRLPTLD